MQLELERSIKKLKLENHPPPYFISYTVMDKKTLTISSKYGGIVSSKVDHKRPFEVEVRVGDYEFDNTEHPSEIPFYELMEFPDISLQLPLENNIDVIRHILWLATDFRYKQALKQFSDKKARLITKVKKEKLPSFWYQEPTVFIGEELHLQEREIEERWKEKVRKYSAKFKNFDEIFDSEVIFSVTCENKYYINSEGTKIQTGNIFYSLMLFAKTITDDGMPLWNYRNFYGYCEADLPNANTIERTIKTLVEELIALKNSDKSVPYSGPVIIKSPASAIFFHEVLGHRLEGHRQESEIEAETFKDKINKKIMPHFITVYDDPTLKYYKGQVLYGHYLFDEEGVPARKTILVENGILKSFLLSRLPIKGFKSSTGHGRKEISQFGNYLHTVPRQANFIVETSKPVSFEKLKKMLIKECKKQKKPYGLIITHSYSGATTTRYWIQSFLQKPILAYKVDVKTGKEKIVRGIEFGGTPLISLDKIIACGDDPKVFNGICGGESGIVRISLVAPSILVSELEIQKTREETTRPPLLPLPWEEE